jgi:transposase
MGEIKTIGLDIAKNIFQLHGVDADGQVVLRHIPAPGADATLL